jgi:hypothetical protein
MKANSDHFTAKPKVGPLQSPCQGQDECRFVIDFFCIDTLDKDSAPSTIGGLKVKMAGGVYLFRVCCFHFLLTALEQQVKQ